MLIAGSKSAVPFNIWGDVLVEDGPGIERERDGNTLKRLADGKTYPDHIDPDYFDEIFPPIVDDILHHAMREANEIHIALALAGEVLELARKRQQIISCLHEGNRTVDSLHRMEVDHLKQIALDLSLLNLSYRNKLTANGLIP